ncbi:uncharacterized protein JCM6883_000119 [Sporobolomyces salmoneus]|uniref:uncharacterized protein n=1 Tax=Sporobolomyces salmoneus TaxID=183962 RepID=UPI0031773B93
MSSLFIQPKKRVASGSSRSPIESRPPPSGPSSTSHQSNAFTNATGHVRGGDVPPGPNGGRTRPFPPAPPPPFASSSVAAGPSRSNSLPQQASVPIPYASLSPTVYPADTALKAKLESILSQILQLFKLQSQTLESASTTTSGSFEMSDLASEEAEELRKLWDEGMRQISERERKERETLGTAVVDNLGGLLMQLVDRIGTDLADKKIEVLKREVEALKSSSSSSPSSSAPSTTTTQPSTFMDRSTSVPPTNQALTAALARIEQLEQSLARSDKERVQLRQEIADKDQKFEQRLHALENKTTDPRRRAQPVGGTTSIQSPVTQPNGEVENLRTELEQLKERLNRAESSLGKRKRVEEDENSVENISRRDVKTELEDLQNKIQIQIASFELPLPSSPSHPTQLQQSFKDLSDRLSSLPGNTESESNLLRGLHEFIASTMSETDFENLSLFDITPLLRDRLFKMSESIGSLEDTTTKLDKASQGQSKQLQTLYDKLNEMKPLLNYFEKKALPGNENGANSTGEQPSGGSNSQSARDQNGVRAESSGAGVKSAEEDSPMEESEDEETVAVAKQLVGANGSGAGGGGGAGGSVSATNGGREKSTGFAEGDSGDEGS